jgi:hypothetical protein
MAMSRRNGLRVLCGWAIFTALVAGLILAIRRVGPESTFEPGLEFNPDFDLTPEEMLADIRGEAPHG